MPYRSLTPLPLGQLPIEQISLQVSNCIFLEVEGPGHSLTLFLTLKPGHRLNFILSLMRTWTKFNFNFNFNVELG